MSSTSPVATSAGSSAAANYLGCLRALDRKVQWLSAWTIHHANHVRPSRDGLKVGGHQASSASLATVMSALYFSVLTPRDRVAVKPHASPAYHAIQYLLGNQTLEQLENFRGLGGAQAYPSRTKDRDGVDFSTGSVGLGVAITAFASLAQDYLLAKGWLDHAQAGRMISLLGDAELDEGNIYEALIEGTKHELRNTWWIIDYNRQSLDAVTSDLMFTRYEEIFEAAGWEVITLKYGKQQQTAFSRPGGERLRGWIDECPNSLYSALTYRGGGAWRERLLQDAGDDLDFRRLVGGYDDDELHALMVNLGGHDMEFLLETFHAAHDDRPKCFIAYTIKGWGLPFQGHKDNHAGLMSQEQMSAYREQMRIAPGREWHRFAGLEVPEEELADYLAGLPLTRAARQREHTAPKVPVPSVVDFPRPHDPKQATQVAFGRIMHALARSDDDFAKRVVTTSPDVTVSTNLGGWVNQQGIFSRERREDVFQQQDLVSLQKWSMSRRGQHIELGIAENNLFLLLAALGLTGPLFGERLLPVGTLYDPFICRGLDALNYACYQDARFMLVATPSGLTLAPEGGAHQSINTPLIGMAQDKLTYFEPAYVDELVEVMRWGFDHMQRDDGGSVYLRLSTRALVQPQRDVTDDWRAQVLDGAYWYVPPATGAELALVYCGAVAPEVIAAHQALLEDLPGIGLLAVTSPDRLHAAWMQSVRTRGELCDTMVSPSPVESLLAPLGRDAALVTVLDGAPETLSWLGSVHGHRLYPLGVDRFGQSGDIDDLYATHRIGVEAILDACASAMVHRASS